MMRLNSSWSFYSFSSVIFVRSLKSKFAVGAAWLLIFVSFHLVFRSRLGINQATVCPSHISQDDFSPKAIRCRILSAQAKARSGLKSQSSTPEEAAAEYRRRYRRSPPKGFDKWVIFAMNHESKIIDNFDQIDRDLEPYRDPVARRTVQALQGQSWDCPLTSRITIQNGSMSTSATYMFDKEWRMLLEPFINEIPDCLFYLSNVDEPRILGSSGPQPPSVEFQDMSGESFEDVVVESCVQTDLQMIESLDHYRDVCRFSNPSNLHSFIASPATLSYTRSLIPILSYSRMSAFRDILIPCPRYAAQPLVVEDQVSFLEKRRAIYWRGSSTGGRATRSSWRHGHRVRFVTFIQSLQNAAKDLYASQFSGSEPGIPEKKKSELFKDVFDVNMGAYIQCDDDACKDMERVLGPPSYKPENTSANYRYLYDIDGNSMSARFYRLISREAVVFKQTWFQEWHDDRLVPWAHYVPVTMTLEELPALISFLIGDPSGEVLSAEIAHAGSSWSREVLREIDMSIYLYRLLLELAELYGSNNLTR